MKIKRVLPNDVHMKFRVDVLALLNKHAGALPAEEMLAVAAHVVGQIVAFQDYRTMTPADAMKLVVQNIEAGNAEAIAALEETKGNA